MRKVAAIVGISVSGLIVLRTDYRDPQEDAYLYRTRITPENAQRVFKEYVHKINEVKERPNFHNTLTTHFEIGFRKAIKGPAWPKQTVYDGMKMRIKSGKSLKVWIPVVYTGAATRLRKLRNLYMSKPYRQFCQVNDSIKLRYLQFSTVLSGLVQRTSANPSCKSPPQVFFDHFVYQRPKEPIESS
jgi:hypothetical protein